MPTAPTRMPFGRLLLTALLAVCSCAGTPPVPLGPPAGVQCAPFARALTGIALSGPADGWWGAASGRYARGQAPSIGSVLVFARSARLPSGHVAVVADVLSGREVLLTQANWLHGHVGIDQPARDVSRANDWSVVRVFWPPRGQLGTTPYATYGFIAPPRPTNRARLDAGVPRAVARAEQGW